MTLINDNTLNLNNLCRKLITQINHNNHNNQNNLFVVRQNEMKQAKQGFSRQKFMSAFLSESFLNMHYLVKNYFLSISSHYCIRIDYLNFRKHWIDNVSDDIQ